MCFQTNINTLQLKQAVENNILISKCETFMDNILKTLADNNPIKKLQTRETYL